MTDYVLEWLRKQHPGKRITARQWVDANGVDVAEYEGELLSEVPPQFQFVVARMAERARRKRESRPSDRRIDPVGVVEEN
jgi:hypothetical protein